MVLGVEMELDHASDGRGETVGLEREVGVFVRYFDDIDGCGGGRAGCAACARGHHCGGCGGHVGGHGGLGNGAAGEKESGNES